MKRYIFLLNLIWFYCDHVQWGTALGGGCCQVFLWIWHLVIWKIVANSLKSTDSERKILKEHISQATVLVSKTHKLFELRKFHIPFSTCLQQFVRPLSNAELTNTKYLGTEVQKFAICYCLCLGWCVHPAFITCKWPRVHYKDIMG